jgi:predicted HTH transcriptional regulator
MSNAPSISAEQIDSWRRAASESQQLEFKEARTQFDISRLREYCVALANEGGGHLLLGIADRLPRTVVGTQASHTIAVERSFDPRLEWMYKK